jgi:hypothetical protein
MTPLVSRGSLFQARSSAVSLSRYISAVNWAVEVPGMLRSNRLDRLGIGTVLPVALAVRLITNSVSSVAAATSAAVGTRVTDAGRATAKPIQQFSFGIKVDMAGLLQGLPVRFDGMGSGGPDPG